MKKTYIYIIAAAVLVTGLTAFLPRRASSEKSNVYQYGLPLSFVVQEKSIDYSEQQSVPLEDVREHPTRFNWVSFLLNTLLLSAVMVVISKIKEARSKKNAPKV
ncbi:MAG: hypothetical protein QY323_00920 [Patescibacteria group bacterium]|nr:MAG: hypothetical protein QY323_00920 [Patescibacteria group bacterium]